MKPDSGRIEQADLGVRYPQIRGATEALAQGLSAVSARLEPKEAAQAASTIAMWGSRERRASSSCS